MGCETAGCEICPNRALVQEQVDRWNKLIDDALAAGKTEDDSQVKEWMGYRDHAMSCLGQV